MIIENVHRIVSAPRNARLSITIGASFVLLLVLLFSAASAFVQGRSAAAQFGAEAIRSFNATYVISSGGLVEVTEEIAWDFAARTDRHGIFRDLIFREDCPETIDPATQLPVYPCPTGYYRTYGLSDVTVQVRRADGSFGGVPTKTEDVAGSGGLVYKNIRIGDADKTVSGVQTYRISYRLKNALTEYGDHDEFFWNVTGKEWDVPVQSARFTFVDATGRADSAVCFEGFRSTKPCTITKPAAPTAAWTFAATRTLQPGEELSIAMRWPANTFPLAEPDYGRDKRVEDFFEGDALELGAMAGVGAFSVLGLVALWWRVGRDRRYKSLYYLTNDPTEHTRPLFGGPPVVVEFTPPEDLRPAQMGLIIDERADPLDVTATIVDLAVRGYLHITEIPKEGLFGGTDWNLTKLKEWQGDEALQTYERTILSGLFDSHQERKLSELKNKFYDDLATAQGQLYRDAMQRKWFPAKPGNAKNIWRAIGIGIAIAGVGLAVATGWFAGRALIGLPVILAGLIMAVVLASAMSRRTAKGSEALRRVLGFRLYVATAETRRQEFNEQQGIFARYLPYAIVFGCVDKWSKAFEGLEGGEAASVGSFYTGAAIFNAAIFSRSLNNFSSNISSTITSAPSSSGGSGFSGGGSSGGGGGGGGGGGSW